MNNPEKKMNESHAGPRRSFSVGERWYFENLANFDKPVERVVSEDQRPRSLTKGWIISFRDHELIDKLQYPAFVLRPDESIYPFSDAAKAAKQLKSWEKSLGGKVAYLLVPDNSQGEKPWLAQPVLRDWVLEYSPNSLLELYNHAQPDDPKKLQYRAAFIVSAGCKPEEYASPLGLS